MTPLRRARELWQRLTPRTRLAIPALLTLSVAARLVAVVGSPSLPEIPALPEPDRAIALVMLDDAAFAHRMALERRAAFDESMRCQRITHLGLGLVTSSEPPLHAPSLGWLDLATGPLEAKALYATGTDTVFSRVRDHSVLRHEMVHALDDQSGDRLRRAATAATTDERLALRAVVEGTALLLTGSFGIESPPWRGDLDDAAWIAAYTYGPLYVRTLAGTGSASAHRMLQIAPSTTHELLFPGIKRGARPMSIAPAELDRGQASLCHDQLGAIGVVTAMVRSGASQDDALLVGRAWRGDRAEWVSGPEGEHAVWTVALDSDEAIMKWRLGPQARAHLTAAQAILLTVKAESEQPGSPFDALGR